MSTQQLTGTFSNPTPGHMNGDNPRPNQVTNLHAGIKDAYGSRVPCWGMQTFSASPVSQPAYVRAPHLLPAMVVV